MTVKIEHKTDYIIAVTSPTKNVIIIKEAKEAKEWMAYPSNEEFPEIFYSKHSAIEYAVDYCS